MGNLCREGARGSLELTGRPRTPSCRLGFWPGSYCGVHGVWVSTRYLDMDR